MSGTHYKKRKQTGAFAQCSWDFNEETRFLLALELFGGDYCARRAEISKFVATRSPDQVRSYGYVFSSDFGFEGCSRQKLLHYVSYMMDIWRGNATESDFRRVQASRRRVLPDALQGDSFENTLRAEYIRIHFLKMTKSPRFDSVDYFAEITKATESCEQLLAVYHQRKEMERKDPDSIHMQFQQFLYHTPPGPERSTQDIYVMPGLPPDQRRTLLLSGYCQQFLGTLVPRRNKKPQPKLQEKQQPSSDKKEEKLMKAPMQVAMDIVLASSTNDSNWMDTDDEPDNIFVPLRLPNDHQLDAELEAKWQQFRAELFL